MNDMVKYGLAGALAVAAVASIFLFNRKSLKAATPERMRALLFANQALEDLISNPTTVSAQHPAWAVLKSSRALIEAGEVEEARAQLRGLIEDAALPTRIRLWGWGALRSMGDVPPESAAAEVQGAVVEIPQAIGIDTLAVYAGGTLRYIAASGNFISRDTPDDATRAQAQELLNFLTSVAASLIATTDHPEPGIDKVYVTALTFAGARYASAPLKELQERRHPFSKVYLIATELIERVAREG